MLLGSTTLIAPIRQPRLARSMQPLEWVGKAGYYAWRTGRPRNFSSKVRGH